MSATRRKPTLPDPIRQKIERIAANRKISLAELSKNLGKAHSYMSQYLTRGIPHRLPHDIREKLAELLNLDEQELGASHNRSAKIATSGILLVPAPGAQAGAGGGRIMAEDDLSEEKTWPFPRDYVRHVLSLETPNDLEVIEIIGDSMFPTLWSGDRALVNRRDKRIANPGIFMLYDGDAEVVKRIEVIPASSPPKVKLISDNKLHSDYEVLLSDINVAGRVVWYGRRL